MIIFTYNYNIMMISVVFCCNINYFVNYFHVFRVPSARSALSGTPAQQAACIVFLY